MADKIAEHMAATHTKFIRNATPSKLEKSEDKIKVTYDQEGKSISEEFDTVLFAIGRYAFTGGLNLNNAGV